MALLDLLEAADFVFEDLFLLDSDLGDLGFGAVQCAFQDVAHVFEGLGHVIMDPL